MAAASPMVGYSVTPREKRAGDDLADEVESRHLAEVGAIAGGADRLLADLGDQADDQRLGRGDAHELADGRAVGGGRVPAVSSTVAFEPVTATTRPMASFIARAAEAAETTGEVGARRSIVGLYPVAECSQERPKLMD